MPTFARLYTDGVLSSLGEGGGRKSDASLYPPPINGTERCAEREREREREREMRREMNTVV